jgi:hypothetical protein
MPIEIFPPNSVTTSTANIGLQYLCGPNTVLYDTTGPQYCREVYINNNSTLYLLADCAVTDFIWVKSGCTLNIKSGSQGIIEIVSEPGAIINHPPGPHSYTSYTIACISITYPNINCTTGINENKFGFDFEFYPNPANSWLAIISEQQIDNISVSNISGQQLLIEYANATHHQLQLNDLAEGIYFVKCTYTNGMSVTKKIVVNR